MNDIFASILEFGGLFYLGQFSDDLYNNSFYTGIGLVALLVPLLLMFIFYKTANSGRNKVGHWLLALFSSSVLTSLICTIMADSQLKGVYDGGDLPWGWSELIGFFLCALVVTLIFGFLYSLGLKYINSNTRKCPF